MRYRPPYEEVSERWLLFNFDFSERDFDYLMKLKSRKLKILLRRHEKKHLFQKLKGHIFYLMEALISEVVLDREVRKEFNEEKGNKEAKTEKCDCCEKVKKIYVSGWCKECSKKLDNHIEGGEHE